MTDSAGLFFSEDCGKNGITSDHYSPDYIDYVEMIHRDTLLLSSACVYVFIHSKGQHQRKATRISIALLLCFDVFPRITIGTGRGQFGHAYEEVENELAPTTVNKKEGSRHHAASSCEGHTLITAAGERGLTGMYVFLPGCCLPELTLTNLAGFACVKW